MIEEFAVTRHSEEECPIIKGNSFDDLKIGEDREEAEEFIDFVNNIIDFCNDLFVDCTIQPYAGARSECLYCGAVEQRDGTIDHSICPIIKYESIMKMCQQKKRTY
jgi:hypothetical protein